MKDSQLKKLGKMMHKIAELANAADLILEKAYNEKADAPSAPVAKKRKTRKKSKKA